MRSVSRSFRSGTIEQTSAFYLKTLTETNGAPRFNGSCSILTCRVQSVRPQHSPHFSLSTGSDLYSPCFYTMSELTDDMSCQPHPAQTTRAITGLYVSEGARVWRFILYWIFEYNLETSFLLSLFFHISTDTYICFTFIGTFCLIELGPTV